MCALRRQLGSTGVESLTSGQSQRSLESLAFRSEERARLTRAEGVDTDTMRSPLKGVSFSQLTLNRRTSTASCLTIDEAAALDEL